MSCATCLPTRSTEPYRAYVMASRIEDFEVDGLVVTEGREPLELEPDGTHQAPSASRARASSKASRISTDGSAPCWTRKYASNWSRGRSEETGSACEEPSGRS